jgi:hypothetical protein
MLDRRAAKGDSLARAGRDKDRAAANAAHRKTWHSASALDGQYFRWRLAGAVSKAGSLGVIGGGSVDVACIEREARDQHELTVYSGS